jgi:hypothetical protein
MLRFIKIEFEEYQQYLNPRYIRTIFVRSDNFSIELNDHPEVSLTIISKDKCKNWEQVQRDIERVCTENV